MQDHGNQAAARDAQPSVERTRRKRRAAERNVGRHYSIAEHVEMSRASMREAILGSLAGPPKPLALSVIRPEKIVILEWLFETDRRTGHELNVWLQNHFPGWSTYFPCRTKRDVHNAIRSAIRLCRAQDIVPVLHIEAHGSPLGLHGPDRHGTEDTASWEELTEPLQILNLASACNLIVFIAACIGFAGIQAFHRGPRSPALALIGPDDDVEPNPLLNGSKEFYRRMRDIGWSISAAAESASREMAPIGLEVEPFATMALDSMVRSLLISRALATWNSIVLTLEAPAAVST